MAIVMMVVVVVMLVRGIAFSPAQTPLLSFRLVCKVSGAEPHCPCSNPDPIPGHTPCLCGPQVGNTCDPVTTFSQEVKVII